MSLGTDKPQNCVSDRTPKCLPPRARKRRNGQRSQPMTAERRAANYRVQLYRDEQAPTGTDSRPVTRKQQRRIRAKENHAQAKAARS